MFAVGSSLHLLNQSWWFDSAWHHGTQRGVRHSYRGGMSQNKLSSVCWSTAPQLGHEAWGSSKGRAWPYRAGDRELPRASFCSLGRGRCCPCLHKVCTDGSVTTLRSVWRKPANVLLHGRRKKQLRGSSETLWRWEPELPTAQKRDSQKQFGLMKKMGSLVLFFAPGEWLVLQLQVCKCRVFPCPTSQWS